MSRLPLALVAFALVACECEPETSDAPEVPERHPAEGETEPTLRELFPLGLGDRWDYERRAGSASATRETSSITAHLGELGEGGVALRFTDGSASAARFELVRDDTIALVDDEGRAIAPWLKAPLHLGAGWTYPSGDAECGVEVVRDGREVRVGALTLRRCVEVERVCRYPAGKPLPQPIVQRHEELYCPGVGLVEEHVAMAVDTRADTHASAVPAAADVTSGSPPGAEAPSLPPDLARRLVRFRVAGGPTLVDDDARAPGCDDLFLLPADVQRACPGLSELRTLPGPEGCMLRFEGPAATGRPTPPPALVVTLSAAPLEAQRLAAWSERTLEPVVEGNDARGWIYQLARTPGACPAADRLEPVVRSLLRP